MRNQKNERGITLVALVVTIVVLLILAGITITYVLSDDGIFGRAKEAASGTEDGSVREYAAMGILDVQTESYVNSDATAAEYKKVFTDNFPKDSIAADDTGTVTVTPASTSEDGTVTPVSIVITGVKVTLNNKSFTVSYNSADATPTADPKTVIKVTPVTSGS